MNITAEQLELVLNGDYSFSQLGFSMLVTRVKGMYYEDPTPSTLESCTREINAFLGRYSNVMQSDCAILSKIKGA